MSEPNPPPHGRPSEASESSEATGGAGELLVDVSHDRRARVIWLVFLAGPMLWFAHFMFVYLVVEAGCTGDGHGLNVFDPPVSDVVTLVATAVAGIACLACAQWAHRGWRAGTPVHEPGESGAAATDLDEHVRAMSFAGFLLALLSFVAVLLAGLPALFLSGC